ncbi:Cof-type HAD-IIB family hydrolase [uncultured Selenomonas sp.]|uniref:Cof-type HAD-IIB family hydrolase n=1 Tax=uncultured Selenomonas sp. TaxID=159275 RepID=UPI0025F71CAC|nr:Cof-type HAD-IIB family hydrolase [uncultured Selenomonas sp.]
MQSPKIIFSDIDGTFLQDDHTVSARNAEAVRALLASGIPFVLVSARMPEAIYPIMQSIGVTIPIISYSGALALTAEGETLEDVRVDAGAAGMVLSALEDRYPELTVNYYAGRRWYVRDEDDPRVRHEEDITHSKSERGNFDMLLSINTLPSKILLMGEPAVCERAESDLAAAYPMLHVVRSAPNLVEIMEASVSKESGIRAMLGHYGLTADDALSFGDNYNDLEMLRFTKTSVAMANAPEDIKKAATDVTKSNAEDGIWWWLKEKGII